MSVFETLNNINVNDKTEEKGNLTYLSWAWAWAEVKKAYPDANYKIYENENGWNYFTDGRTCWVKTGVIIDNLEHIEYLPVLDFKNHSIPYEKVTSYDVNKTIQRSLTKACARHGLGLYIYAGEDLPEIETETINKDESKDAPKKEEPRFVEIKPLTKEQAFALIINLSTEEAGTEYKNKSLRKVYEDGAWDVLDFLKSKATGTLKEAIDLLEDIRNGHQGENK